MYAGAASLYLVLWWRFRQQLDMVLMVLLTVCGIWTKREGTTIALLLLSAFFLGEMLHRGLSNRESSQCFAGQPNGCVATVALVSCARSNASIRRRLLPCNYPGVRHPYKQVSAHSPIRCLAYAERNHLGFILARPDSSSSARSAPRISYKLWPITSSSWAAWRICAMFCLFILEALYNPHRDIARPPASPSSSPRDHRNCRRATYAGRPKKSN